MIPKQLPNYMAGTKSSKERKKASGTLSAPSVVSAVTTSKSQTITIRNPEFRNQVLEPRGIAINVDYRSVGSPEVHFGVPDPSDYAKLPGMEDATIWLHTDERFLEDVQREYRFMSYHQLCEAEYASFAKENLLRREPRHQLPDITGTPGGRLRRVERMVEFFCKPGSIDGWHEPPIVRPSDGSTYPSYDFNIRPDCTYWLALHAFNPEYVSQVHEITAAPQDRMTCPYLTVEFKRDDTTLDKAYDQVATFGAVALYSRYRLRAQTIDEGQDWTPEQTGHMRHYALTATGTRYLFWCIRPKLRNGEWNGCEMEKVFGDKFDKKGGVKNFAHWINAIHRWALTEYLDSCEKDVKLILKRHNFRTSDIKD